MSLQTLPSYSLPTYTRPVPGAPSKKRSLAVSQESSLSIAVIPTLEIEPDETDEPSMNALSSLPEQQPWEIAGLSIETIFTTDDKSHEKLK
jgi:hypothetical protein